MSYVTVRSIQAWLESSKHPINSVDPELETAAITFLFGEMGQRYDTSSWINSSTTPTVVVTLIAMQIASYELRKATSEDDGLATYADYLEQRIHEMCSSIVSGAFKLPDEFIVDSTSSLGGGPLFFPTDGSTSLSTFDPSNADASSRAFTMNMEF